MADKTMARRMLTKEEIKNHIPAFESKAWLERKRNRAKKVERKNNE